MCMSSRRNSLLHRAVAAHGNGLLPAGEELILFSLIHKGREYLFCLSHSLELVHTGEYAGSEARQEACSQRGAFGIHGTVHVTGEDIGAH